MDWELLKTWGIEEDSDPKKICDTLEERQLALIQMRRSENDSAKKAEIAEELKNIEKQLKLAKKEARKKPEDSAVSAGSSFDEAVSEEDKDAEMKRKLDELKRQEEQRREDEKARAEALQPDDTGDGKDDQPNNPPVKPVQPTPVIPSPQSTGTEANLGTVPAGDSKQQMQKGIAEYNNGNFNAAFVIFNDLAQKGNPEAEYYLSQLFNKGQGTSVDRDKAVFWLKKSADHKYVEAQYAYAITLLSNRTGTDPLPKEGMQHLAKAAEQDFQPAMKQYIDIVLKGYHEFYAIKNAIQYASKLQSLLSDQYEINVYKQKEEQLKDTLTEGRKRESSGKVLKCIEILSPIILVFGFLYLLGGAHPDEWSKNALLSVFPDAPAFLIIPFYIFWMLILPVLTVNGQFGLELITLAYIGRSIYKAKQNIKIKNALSTVSRLIVVAIIIWHILLVIIEGRSFSEGIIYFVLAVVVCRVFGFIISKLVMAVVNAQTTAKKVVLSIVIVATLVCINIFSVKIPAINEAVRQSASSEVKTNGNAEESDKSTKAISAELTNEDISNCQIVNVSSIDADSVLVSSKGNRYEAAYMIDGDTATSWQEGEDGAGEGITFTAGFEGEATVDYIVIYNGNQKSEKLYANNNRICSLKIIIDGQSTTVELADTMDPQIIRLEGADGISQIQFEIVSVYSGNKYNDTCVAEVQFFCE